MEKKKHVMRRRPVLNGGFYTFQEFLEVCRVLRFVSGDDYKERYVANEKLPSNPNIVYGEEWSQAGGWSAITGNTERTYYSFDRFIKVVKDLGIRNEREYFAFFKLQPRDPLLPRSPGALYGKEWVKAGGWRIFTQRRKHRQPPPEGFYSFPEFLKACNRMKFTGVHDYDFRYREDPRLPSLPSYTYGEDWVKAGKSACLKVWQENVR